MLSALAALGCGGRRRATCRTSRPVGRGNRGVFCLLVSVQNARVIPRLKDLELEYSPATLAQRPALKHSTWTTQWGPISVFTAQLALYFFPFVLQDQTPGSHESWIE